MSSMKQCRESLAHYIKARIPLIVIQASELGRSVELIKSVTRELVISNVFLHSGIYGTVNLMTEKKVDDDRTIYGAVSFITAQIEKKQRSLSLILIQTSLIMNLTMGKISVTNIRSLMQYDQLWPDSRKGICVSKRTPE